MKKFFLILSIFLICLFLIPRPARAFLGTGIFDYFEAALGGIEEKSAPICRIIVLMLFTAFIGIISLFTSASLLQWVINRPDWVTVKTPLVDSGLYFTTGLVNLFIILLFVAIAIAWILKIESFAAKKALPKLILVALLVNFVRVFVGIPLDIAAILHRTILPPPKPGEAGIIFDTIGVIFGDLQQMAIGIGSWIAALAVLFIIPFVAPFAQLSLVLLVAGGILFLPTLLSFIIQTVLAILLSTTFFTMAFLFGCRVYIIQFLTILAPIAFLCMVLPQTEKHWKEWLHHLLSWSFFGIIVLLFLVLGVKGAKFLQPGGIPPTLPAAGWLSLPNSFGYYFFLFIYISIISWLSKKTAPEMADFLIGQGTAVFGMIGGAGMILGRGMGRQFGEALSRQKETEEEAERKKKEGKKLSRGERLAAWGPSKRITGAMRWGYRQTTGIYPEEAEARRMKRIEAEAMKIETPETFEAKLRDAKRSGDVAAMRAYTSAGIEKGKEFKETVTKIIPRETAERLAAEANRVGRSKEAERIARAYIDKLDEAGLERMGFKSLNQLIAEGKTDVVAEWKAKGYEKISDKIIGESKGDDLKDFAKGFWKSVPAMEAIQKFWGGPQLGKAADEFGREFVDKYADATDNLIKKIKIREYVQRQPKAAMYLTGTAAQDLGYRAPAGLGRAEIRRMLEEERRRKKEEEERIKAGMRGLFGRGRGP